MGCVRMKDRNKRRTASTPGPLACGEGVQNELRLVATLVEAVHQRDGGRWVTAAAVVLDELERQSGELELFVRQHNDHHAKPIHEHDESASRRFTISLGSSARFRREDVRSDKLVRMEGRTGGRLALATQQDPHSVAACESAPELSASGQVLQRMRAKWCDPDLMPDGIADPELRRYAVRETLAQRMLALHSEAASACESLEVRAEGSVAAPEEAHSESVVQPEGGSWPHRHGTTWTDDERVAVFKMRHLSKLTGERIAKVVGVARQTLDEVAGAARSPKTGNWSCDWRPSTELLNECGFRTKSSEGARALQVVTASRVGK